MLPAAIECFLLQSYPNKQLLIMDDSDQRFDLMSLPPRLWSESVLYNRREKQAVSLGAKRNALCEIARSEYIAHWDDDDWYHPLRLQEQVANLSDYFLDRPFPVAVTGYDEVPFYDVQTGAVHVYKGRAKYAVGSSLMYRRDWWLTHPFIESGERANNGEDTAFVWSSMDVLYAESGLGRMVARIHPRSATLESKDFKAREWTPRAVSTLPREFRELVAA